jgi:hypothetical protein
VIIEAPIAQAMPTTKKLCSIDFATDKSRPTRVDNEAKACLDDIALNLVQDPNAKVVLVGESDAAEKETVAKAQKQAAHQKHAKRVLNPAAQRAVNAKQYLVTDKGIDASRIGVATSPRDGKQVENYFVASGADFNTDVPGTATVQEADVTPQVRKPLGQRHPGKPAHVKTQ